MVAPRIRSRRSLAPPDGGLAHLITLWLAGTDRTASFDMTGPGWLEGADIAAEVEDALVSRHEVCYALFAWCVLPNRLCAMVALYPDQALGDIVKSWKVATAFRANRLIGRKGLFWARGYLLSPIATEVALTDAVGRIEAAPVAAGLSRTAAEWPWSSARWRRGAAERAGPS